MVEYVSLQGAHRLCAPCNSAHNVFMTTTYKGVAVSPVNMEDRKQLGIKAGDTVRVHQKIQDKGKTRIQIFDGLVLARKHGNEPGATFTVRKVASGVGVEKIYPLYSPAIDKIEIVKRAKVRRAKLYYIREKVTKEVKRQMRRMSLVSLSSESEIDAAARKEKEAQEEAERAEAEAKAAEEAAAKAEEAVTDLPAEDSAQAGEATGDAAEPESTEGSEEQTDESTDTPAEESKEESSEEETPSDDSFEEDSEKQQDTDEADEEKKS